MPTLLLFDFGGKLMTQAMAFLGLGVMGASMTANLAKAGLNVKAWNRTPNRPGVEIAKQAGAIIVPSIKEAVESAHFIFTCLGDVPDVEEVILGTEGVAKYAQPGSLVVDFTTIGSQAVRKIAEELKQYNLRFLDAPISGGDIGAKNGTLTIMVGGNPEDFAECKPYFEIMGKNITLCGEVGSGQGVKLCNQVLASLYMVGLCEAVKLAQSQGIDPQLVVDVCSTGAAGSWALTNLGPKIIAENYNPGFMIKHILKDLRLVQEVATQELPGVELADRLFKLVAELDNGEGSLQGTQGMIRAYNN
jgi:3-hydroxyisobutyrate dehydrogenase